MRRNQVLGYTLAGLLAVLIGQGVATAQAPDGGGDEPAPPTPATPKQVNLSPSEQVTAASQYTQRMESIRTTIRRELEEARARHDVVKTLCLNDKLNQLDVAIRGAEERRHSLELAAKRGDQDLAT